MKEEEFQELAESVRQAKAIMQGKESPSRKFVVEALDVKEIRSEFQMSQSQFSGLLGISVKTLRNWEQGRRTPRGPARVLLEVAAKHPDAVWDVVRSDKRKAKAAKEHLA